MARRISKAALVVGGLVLVCLPTVARAQLQPQAVTHVASLAPGSILGVVQDERGLPVPGAFVSALGTTTAVVVTDRSGRFELRTLTPGPYLLRAHLSGFVASRGQVVEVRSSVRSTSSIAIRRAAPVAAPTVGPTSMLPILAAGVGTTGSEPAAQPEDGTAVTPPTDGASDSHGEIAWRLRHARRGILKDVDVPDEILVTETPPDANAFGGGSVLDIIGSPARLTNLFAGTAFSGQVNVLTTGSFESPQQLFNGENFSRSITYLALGAPVGDRADWTVRAALTQGDIASWILAGEYITRAPARHRYDLGWSYSTQRYDGGNVATLSNVTDGSRNAGLFFGYDTFSLAPSVTLTYGARYAHYDYLDDRNLLSPRLSVTVEPIDHFRISGTVSRRLVAPGAEEFMPRMESGVWLPPQRTFASLDPWQMLRAEQTNHVEVAVDRDIAAATVSVRAFHQHTGDQQVTLFGVDMPQAPSHVGHYFIANAGDIDASGISAGIRAAIGSRVHGSVEWSTTRGHALGGESTSYLWVVAPSAIRTELDRIHDVATSVETEVPETATRIIVLYRVSNAFAHPVAPVANADRPALDARFDVQVRQSLPFMDFSTAKWEMLVGVRNFVRDTAPDQSIYDELLVVRPPKRVIGGLTLKF
jgi:TonB dependent receptor-like, beta-barrel/Carboxypeptidase regulatory-like domain